VGILRASPTPDKSLPPFVGAGPSRYNQHPMTQEMQVSVILPTYNERGNIIPLIEQIERHLPELHEIIVVDDHSPDGTWQVVGERATNDPKVRLIDRTTERGLTSALNRGITEARGNVVAWMDCDLSMPPAVLPAFLDRLADHDLVAGSRYVPGGRDAGHSWTARTASRLVCRFAALTLNSDIRDQTSGFIAAWKKTFDGLELRGHYGEYCIDMFWRLGRGGARICEVPYTFEPRAWGESKTTGSVLGFCRNGIRYFWLVIRLRLGK
jgi:dolichol-phosphate mannosyltransferase